MRILYDYFIFSNPGYGGISRYFVELASRLGRYPDVSTHIVAPIIQCPFVMEKRNDIYVRGIDISKLRSISPRLVRMVNRPLSRAYAKVLSPDILHETYYDCGTPATRSAKIVTTIHDAIPERWSQFFPVDGKEKQLIEMHREQKSCSLRRADHVICVSESTKNDLMEFYGIDSSRISVIHLASSIDPVSHGPSGIDRPYFLHVGNRYKAKNFYGLIRAFGEARLFKTHKLVSFCATPLTEKELSVAALAGIPEESLQCFTGDDRLLAQFYAGAEALVYPSFYEGFGIPLLEAMRCRCPIITSNVSSLPEVAGDAAIYCDPKDISSIANALTEVAGSSEAKQKLIVNGQMRIQHFSWDRCAAETFDIYKTL